MSGFNMPPGVSPRDIPFNDVSEVDIEEGDMQAVAVMTLRDVFASFVLAGIWANNEVLKATPDAEDGTTLARIAYTQADLMVKARQQ